MVALTRTDSSRRRVVPTEVVISRLALALVTALDIVACCVVGAIVMLGAGALVKVLDGHSGDRYAVSA